MEGANSSYYGRAGEIIKSLQVCGQLVGSDQVVSESITGRTSWLTLGREYGEAHIMSLTTIIIR